MPYQTTVYAPYGTFKCEVNGADSVGRVTRAVFASGERFPYIKGQDGFPVSLALRYAVDKLRLHAKANTIEREMRAILELYRWGAEVESPFSLEWRLRHGALLSQTEVMSFARYVRSGGRIKVAAYPVRVQTRRTLTGVRSDVDFNNRLRSARDFVCWAGTCVRRPEARPDEQEKLKSWFNQELLPSHRAPDRRGLDDEAKEALLRLVDPRAENNPFNRSTRFRNWVMVRLFLETGIRRGELCKLLVGDLVSMGSEPDYLNIVRRPDDPKDPRKNEPQVKTLPRRITLRPDLTRALIEYMRDYRGPAKHRYLFTSSRGGVPMDLGSVNRALMAVRRTSDLLDSAGLTPHVLRYTFSDSVFEALCRDPLSEDNGEGVKRAEIMKYLGGWSERSSQPSQYHRRAVERASTEVLKKMHQENERWATLADQQGSQ